MSRKEYTTELLKLEDAEIEKMEETEEEIILQIRLKRKLHRCPKCEAETDQVHDYLFRNVRDLNIRGKHLRLLYRRRYNVRSELHFIAPPARASLHEQAHPSPGAEQIGRSLDRSRQSQ